MRITSTLLLGAAVLLCAPASAQDASRKVPAVAPLVAGKTTAHKTAANTPAPRAAAPAGDAPPTADAAVEAPLQEAKNNDGTILRDTNGDPLPGQTIDASRENPDDSDSIAATVNDESISEYEVRQRVGLYLATSGITQQLKPDQLLRIRTQILEKLEDEKVQLSEAVKKKITVSPVEVDKWINNLITGNRMSLAQLRAALAQAGTSEDALRAQVTATLAWQKAVQDEYSDRVNITPDLVDAAMARNAEGAHRAHYHVMEIFLPVDNPESDGKVKKDAEEIIKQLRQGAPFAMVARQFSQHPTAATGGDIGWVYDGQLAPELNTAIGKLEVGAIAEPVRSTGGYYIVALRERQEGLGTKIDAAPKGPTGPAGTLPLARLLLPVNPRAPKAELDQIMGIANQVREHFQGCDGLEDVHKRLTGSIYMNLGDMKLAELSPQIQKAMADTQPGEAAQPFFSDAGIEVIARCDKKVEVKTAFVMPTRAQVEDELFQGQISAMARRYLRDLRRNANIQVRDDTKPDALIR